MLPARVFAFSRANFKQASGATRRENAESYLIVVTREGG
jgi:hypothetical protein